MEIAQLQRVLVRWASNIAEVWFSNSPMLLPLAKTLIQANAYRVEEIAKMFTDKDGNVLVNELLDNYEQTIPADGLRIDFRSILGDNIITRNITIKVLERSDISELRRLLTTY